MSLPVEGFVQPVEVVVGGTLPRAGFVQPVEHVGGGPGFITGSGSAGQVTYWTAATVVAGSASFTWDNPNARLTVGGAWFYTTQTGNLFVGQTTGNLTASGDFNLAIGLNAGKAWTTGHENVAIGTQAQLKTTTGYYNVAVGVNALQENLGGIQNVAVGYKALQSNTTGFNNLAIGMESLTFCTSGHDNDAVGLQSQRAVTTGTFNVSLGQDSLRLLTTGKQNVAVGYQCLYSILTVDNNVAVGYQAANALTVSGTTAIGYSALLLTTTGANNTAVGSSALVANVTGGNNTAVGYQALATANAGSNTAIGYNAMLGCSSGTFNTAVGLQALQSLTTANNNTAVGLNGLFGITSGADNVAVGFGAGYNSGTPMLTNAQSVFIGSGANANASGLTNTIVIGYGAQGTASNQVTLGNGSVTSTLLNGTVSGMSTVQFGVAGLLQWSTDTNVRRLGAGLLQLSNGASATAFYVYKTTDSDSAPTVYERCSFQGNSGGYFEIDVFAAGGGAAVRPFAISMNGTRVWQFQTAGDLIPIADASYPLGGASFRVGNTFIGGTLNLSKAGVAMVFTNATTTTGANVGTLTNCPHTGNPALYLEMSVNGTVYAVPCFALT